jgi:hypothetical protein
MKNLFSFILFIFIFFKLYKKKINEQYRGVSVSHSTATHTTTYASSNNTTYPSSNNTTYKPVYTHSSSCRNIKNKSQCNGSCRWVPAMIKGHTGHCK